MGLKRTKGTGEPLEQPTLHARHVHSSQGSGPAGPHTPGPRVLPRQPPRKAHLRPEVEMVREEVLGHPAWGDKWKISNRVQIFFATRTPLAGRLLGNRNGSISRNFLHFSIKLTLGRKGQWAGLALRTEEEREEGRFQGRE